MSEKKEFVTISSEEISDSKKKVKMLLYEKLLWCIQNNRLIAGTNYAPTYVLKRLALNGVNIEKSVPLISEIPGIYVRLAVENVGSATENFIVISDLERVLNFLKSVVIPPKNQSSPAPVQQGGLVGGNSVSQFDQFLPDNKKRKNHEE